jgi:hypothetical protein
MTIPDTNEAGQTFAQWHAAVDALLIARIGLGANDGADWPSYDAWADELTPTDALEAWAEWQDDDMVLAIILGDV